MLIARIVNTPLGPNIALLSGPGFIQGLIKTGITAVFAIGGTFFLFYLLYGGILWISSGSDKAKLEDARSTLVNALIGMFVLISSYALVRMAEGLFGINILLIDISSLIIR